MKKNGDGLTLITWLLAAGYRPTTCVAHVPKVARYAWMLNVDPSTWRRRDTA